MIVDDLEIDPRLGSEALVELVQRYADRPEADALYQEIPLHPNFDETVLDALLSRASDSPSVLNAIVTSGRLSRNRLSSFSNSEFRSVREHVRIGLFMMDLDELEEQRLIEELEAALATIAEDPALLCTLLSHPRTPGPIRDALAKR